LLTIVYYIFIRKFEIGITIKVTLSMYKISCITKTNTPYISFDKIKFTQINRLSTSVLLWFLFFLTLPTWAKEPLKIGILAFRPKVQMIEQWNPLALYLQSELKYSVKLTAYSYTELENAVSNKELDVVITNPANYILLRHRNNLSAPLVTQITNNGDNKLTSFGGVIFTRGKSIITELSELNNQKIALTKRGSLGGYQMQAYELFSLGLPVPNKKQLLTMGMPHDNVVNAVLTGQADVGFVRTGVLESMQKEGKIDFSDINILNKQKLTLFPFKTSTRLYPEWPIATLAHVDTHLARQLTIALLSLQAENPVAIKADIHGFTIPADYSGVESLLRELRIKPFDTAPKITIFEIWEQHTSEFIVISTLVVFLIILGIRLFIQNRFIKQNEQHLLSVQDSLNSTLNAIPDSMFELGLDGTYYSVWTPHSNLLLAEEKELLGKRISDVMEEGAATICLTALQEANINKFSSGHQIKLMLNHEKVWFELSVEKKELGYDGQPIFIVISHDITDRKKIELRERFRTHILELIMSDEPLAEILKAIVQGIEESNPAMLCSILLLDESGNHLLTGAAPSLPNFYNQAIHGIEIGMGVGSCGTAAFTNERVIVEDIQSHPYWAPYKELASQAELRSCWSEPIRSTQGKVLGTFAIYHHDVSQPTKADITLIEQVTSLASVAIEKTQANLELKARDEQMQLVLAGAELGFWDWDIHTDRLERNERWATMLGYTHKEIKQSTKLWTDFIHPDDKDKVQQSINDVLKGHSKFHNIEYRMLNKEVGYRWIHDQANVMKRDSDGKALRMSGTHSDITNRKKAEEKLKLAASVFTHARESVVITDTTGSIIDVNDTFTTTTGYTRNEILGQNPRILQSGRQGAEFYNAMWKDLLNEGYWSGEIWNRRKNGEVYAEIKTISAVRDEHGFTTHYVALGNDITQMKVHQEQLERIAHYDVLTHLPNRTLLADRLSQAMLQCKRYEQSLAVVFLDLDGFKAVNDVYGHGVGDELLIALSLRMKEALREGDSLARFGGDEFVAVLADLASVEDCEPVLERLLTAVSEPIRINDIALNVSASIGVTLYPQDDMDAEQLIRHADQAMYAAKESGKNRYHLFDTAQDDAVKIQREKLKDIRSALDNHQFVLYYQPKVNMRIGTVTGVEALIRWQHPERGLLNPIDFLPIIENNPMNIELGEWVIDTALIQIGRWQKMGLDLPVSISVNISAIQLQQSDFTDRLTILLAAHPEIPPHYLELEVLETSGLEDVQHVSKIMKDCMALGVNFALDDFGTGYSSLTYLRRLPASLIKIDQTFVRDMLNDVDDLAIVEGVIALAKSFKRDVIAEGVETIEHGSTLLELGCELAQGYGIARPMPASDIPAWIKDWKPDISWRTE
jgi:diguanylate cyclase (GGDEF)-like protein/PAS domain S-box-containing protein